MFYEFCIQIDLIRIIFNFFRNNMMIILGDLLGTDYNKKLSWFLSFVFLMEATFHYHDLKVSVKIVSSPHFSRKTYCKSKFPVFENRFQALIKLNACIRVIGSQNVRFKGKEHRAYQISKSSYFLWGFETLRVRCHQQVK